MILKPLYTPSVATSRILELDALRGLAALSVVGYHYTTRYNDIYGHTSDFFYRLPAGRYGVLLFFMISGFVILMSLQRTQRSLDFIVGRLARLYPTYWVAIALTFSAVALIGLPGREVSLKNALLNSLMIHRFWRIPDVDGVYWTLHVEFIFYVLMLGLFILRLLPHIEKVLFIWLSLNALENHHLLINIPERLESWFLPGYAHLFIMGIVFYRIRQQGPSVFRYGLLAGGLASQIALYPEWDKHLAIVLYMVIFFLINAGKLWAIAIPPLMALGTISYPLYLVHQNIGYIVIRDLEMRGLSPIFSIVAAFSVAIALAAVITRFVEQPSLRWIKNAYRKRFPQQVRQAESS
ncbi:MAG: acyltransferase [Elainellaceae cyanobacterium]